MISRRAFLMASAVTAAAGLVVVAPVWLRSRRERFPQGSLPVQDFGAQPLPKAPHLIRRAEWGAIEPDLVNSDEQPYDSVMNPNGWMVYDLPLAEALHTIIVHHSALPLTDGPLEIQQLHMQERRFADVAYHFLIDELGKLYEGRPLNVRGAHTAGHNRGAVGIMLMGNFEEYVPPERQILTLEALVKDLHALYSIDNLAGHRDYNPGITLCPGDHLAVLLPEMAKRQNLRFGV